MFSARCSVALAALVAALVAVVGCGGGQAESVGLPDPEPERTERVVVPNVPTETGEMFVVYEDAESPEAVRGRELLTEANLLEELADDVNAMLLLPVDVPVNGRQCDEANAYWSPSEQAMTICYEDAELSERIFEEAGEEDPLAATLGAERATFYHELGHAVIDLYDLPFTGREEDVADQLAAVLLLGAGDDGTADPENVEAAQAYALMFQGYSEQDGGGAEEFPFWDVHEYDLARMYNFQCWIYGSDPENNAFMVDDGFVPDERADSCEGEFDRMSRAWYEMLEPHLRDE
ncbi:hypothetical protein MCHIJ_19330 [Mycolicibacterium chitae]|uniref:Metallopeptidase DUF4344 n=1 Tax=Mycolicibacterium chitae TaxID=1792 RepID=A0A448HYB6_MYCCI|nr:DUF4344 domain-containing metallopeptidase [Mycolicibacterium chitae]BBZ02496.1 hypothetical protein MCHIJ_19330 [Mycolicibacterium chitae]VEG45114.1 Uncharacterised protein [Mycolicibacterium chitae]